MTLITVSVIEQERPRTVVWFFLKNPPNPKTTQCFLLVMFSEKPVHSEVERTELCHEKAVWKTSPSNTCWVSERCVVAEEMHKAKMRREGIVSLVLWISNFCSKQQMQGFVKDIKLCQLVYR